MKENVKSAKIVLSKRRKSFLSAKFQLLVKNLSPTDIWGYLVVCVKVAQDYLEKYGYHLNFTETISLLLREFYAEMENGIREALSRRGVSHDEANKVLNWFSRLVYLVQEK